MTQMKSSQDKPNIIVTGYARHGKDTVCELLKPYGYSFQSSSRILLNEVIYPALKDKYGYLDAEACFDDRGNHRAEWFQLLCDYNTPDKTKLARKIFESNNIYCGLRSKQELNAILAAKLASKVIWVDASKRLPPEPLDSITIVEDDCSIVICNNGTIVELEAKIPTLVSIIESKPRGVV